MSRHQFSMEYYWRMQAEKISPALSWNEEWDFAEWKKASGAKLRELIGDFPKRVPLMPDVEYSVEEETLSGRELYLIQRKRCPFPVRC